LTAASLLTGCESLRYYTHVASGQMEILRKRQPIAEVMAAAQTGSDLRSRLQRILAIRQFARTELSLPVKNHYLTYTDLGRPYVVWNTFAAPEFSLDPVTWWYPLIGSAAYRGFFSEEEAYRQAAELEAQGYDVYVGGVSAYSTLGWFDDTVFSTILEGDEAATAALMFHELAHQVLYAPGDTTFNESFATTVEQEGLRRWMHASGDPRGFRAYLEKQERREGFIRLVTETRRQLEALYAEDLPTEKKQRRKQEIFSKLQESYLALKSAWGGYAGYDYWFRPPMNNAKLNTVGAYNDLVPAFARLLSVCNDDLPRFYAACRQLAKLPQSERRGRLMEGGSAVNAAGPEIGQLCRSAP
jgi:predicted aminopeptidase